MLRPRYAWLWWLGGWLLVLGVCIGSLTPGDKLPGGLLVANDKLLHAAAYFALMVWFAGLYERRRHVLVALALLAFGIALDLLQGQMSTRSFDLLDVAADAVGILAGLLLSVSWLEGWCARLERRLFAVGA